MKKELLWVGIIGITFGLIIGFGVWRIKSALPSKEQAKPTSTPLAKSGQLKIAIDKPENFSVSTDSPITVSGITKTLTWVVVSTGNKDYLVKSQADGSFSVDVEIDSGINFIKTISVEGSESIQQKVLVIYSPSFQTMAPSASPKADSSESSADAEIKKAVALKLSQVENSPKAYIGTVTDIADSTIQIKSMDSQIQQIETGKYEVGVVNTKGSVNKNVKVSDIAIGDFIVAMGYVDGNDVLDVTRILVANVPAETQISVSTKKVSKVSTKSLTLESDETITPGKNIFINAPLSTFSVSDPVIVVSDITGSPSIVRSLFNLNKK